MLRDVSILQGENASGGTRAKQMRIRAERRADTSPSELPSVVTTPLLKVDSVCNICNAVKPVPRLARPAVDFAVGGLMSNEGDDALPECSLTCVLAVSQLFCGQIN